MSGSDLARGNLLIGRAMGRVVAHELVHMLTKSGQHGTEGVEKPALSGKQLIMGSLPLSAFDIAGLLRVDVPTEMLQQAVEGRRDIYQKTLPLKPGRYRLNIAAKDVVGGNQTTFEMALDVPHIEDDQLGVSSVILADIIEKVPTKNIGTGPFVIGTSKVRPPK